MHIWMIDPAANTPYYDAELTTALHNAGVNIALMTSHYLYTDLPTGITQHSEYFFFKPLSRFRDYLRKFSKVRQIARLLIYPIDMLRFYWYVRRSQPDLLHIQWTFLPLLDRLLFRHISRTTPIILTVHNPMVREARFASLSDMAVYFPIATQLLVHSQNNAKMLIDRFPQFEDKVRIIPHGTLNYQQQIMDKASARQLLGMREDRRVILFFGLIQPYKGLMTLIEAMSQVIRAIPNAHLMIAGKSREDFTHYSHAIDEYALGDNITTRIHFIPNDEVPLYYSAADALCLPYREASQSGILLSAFGYGLPVVVTNVGGLPDMVEEGQNGFIVPPNDPTALAEALIDLLNDDEKRERFGQHSLHLAREKYSWDAVARQTTELYTQVIEENKK